MSVCQKPQVFIDYFIKKGKKIAMLLKSNKRSFIIEKRKKKSKK